MRGCTRYHRRITDKILRTEPKLYPAPGFLDRLQVICENNDITLEQLAEIAQVEVPMFEAFATGERPLGEVTLGRIYEFEKNIDWMWLEHGYDSEDLKVMEKVERKGWTCCAHAFSSN